MRRVVMAVVATALIIPASAFAGGGTGITATPASTKSFDGGNCSATFVRSASGIINETNRTCPGKSSQNDWTSLNVYLQFRPQTGGPANPACDPNGLVVPQFTFTNSEGNIGGTPSSGYFINGVTYNVCVYLVGNQQVSSGQVDSSSPTGTSAGLAPVSNGRYRINVSGEWNNTSHGLVDAEYDNGDGGSDETLFGQDGWPGLGADWGDLFVNGAAVNWGAYNASHAYSTTTGPTNSVSLNVFDGDASDPSNPVVNPGWYGDNVGSLNYTVTYLGQ